MAILVEEIMNRELFSLRPEETVDDAVAYILSLDITGAPVVDAEARPIGMLSFRDAVQADSGRRVDEQMNRPVMSVRSSASIDEAGRLMAESGYHRLVATDDAGRAVGIVSALDVVRGLLGLPAAHPPQFPHYDAATGLVWTDDVPFAAERIEVAPDGPGVFVLIQGGRDVRDHAVWIEASANVFQRLIDLLTLPQTTSHALSRALELPHLHVRAARANDLSHARRIADQLLRRAHGLGLPHPGHGA
jgi:hypothetical protein